MGLPKTWRAIAHAHPTNLRKFDTIKSNRSLMPIVLQIDHNGTGVTGQYLENKKCHLYASAI
jgi:hypothetical protein